MERTCAFLPLPAELAPPAQALAAALGGDRASWGAVLGPLDGRLRALARRRIPLELRGRIEPEDLVQEAYLRILERCTEFEDRGRTSFLGWALRLFENIVADALRHHRRQRRSPEREAARVEGLELADRREGAACPLSQLLEREQSADVAQALAGLGGEERGLLEARFQGGLSYGRIAHERGWSETTTRRRLSELVQRLQVALG